jgi:PKD repeat protein
MKDSITFSFKKLLSFKKRAMLAFSLLCSMGSVMAQSPYCDPYYASQGGDCSTYYMSINAIDVKQGSTSLYSRSHTSSGYYGCPGASGQYTLVTSTPAFKLKAGGSYTIGFTTGPNYQVGVGVWIDLNGDNDFADANEWRSSGWCTPYLTPGSSTLQYFSLTIPTSITAGTTRMRVRTTYSSCTANDNGCTTYNYGEAEDYTITLASDPNEGGVTNIAVPTCSADVVATVSNLGNNDITGINIGWMVDGKAQTPNNYSKTIAIGSSVNVTLSPNFNFVDGQTYNLKVFTYGPNSTSDPDVSNDTARVTFKFIGPAGTPTTTDAVRCGPGKTLLQATTPYKTDSVVWYDKATGGSIVARGKNALSPFLFMGVNTFYAVAAKMSAPTSLANSMSGTTILSANFGSYNGGMIDMTPQADIVIDSFAINMYNGTSNSTYEIWYRTGAYSGNERTSSAWTFVGSGAARVLNIGGKNKAFLKIPELALKGGVTYGFYITTTPTTGNDLYATYGTSTYSNSDISITGGSYIYGQWASNGVYAPYNIDLQTYYRKSACPSARIPIKITVNPAPNGGGFAKGTPFQTTQPNTLGVISNPDIVANGDQLTYTLTPPTGYTNTGYGTKWTSTNLTLKTKKGYNIPNSYYTWTPPSGTNAGVLTFKPDTKLTDTLIYVSLRLADLGPYFCDSTITRHIFVAPRPNPDFSFPQPVCDGDAVVFDNKSTISTGGINYRWDLGTGNAADTSTAFTVVFKFPTYGTYMVTLKATSIPYGYVETKTIPVVVTEIPNINFKVVNACEKVAIQFVNNTTHSSTVAYAWDFGDPTTTLDKSTAKSPTWTYTNSGAYKVTLKATASGCTSELTKNANQFATPKASFNAPALICDKSDVQFTNTSTIKYGNMGYTWNFGDGGVSNFANPVHNFADAASKTVKMKAVSEFGCVDSMTKVLTLSESPKADFSWGPACNLTNTSFTFTGTKPASPAITNFNWNFAGEGTTTVENPSKLFSVVGRKNVTLTLVSNNGCSNSITKEVNVKLQSKADFISGDVCEDDDAVFTNKSVVSQGNLTYNWKFGDGNKSGAASPRHRYNIGGKSQTFNVTLVAVVPGGCSDSITKAVSVNASPDAGFTYKTSGRLVSFTAKQAGATLYQWRFGDGGNSTLANPQYHYLELPSGNYNACLAVVNAANCFAETCQTISITGGIDKLNKLSGVKIYPNPNKGNFTVTVEDPKSDIAIAVYNLLGDVVKVIETNSLKSTYNIDLNVANGVYMVKVTNGGLVSTQKITVSK